MYDVFRIPLVPRRPMTPDPNAPASKSKDPKKDKKPGPAAPEDMPPAPSDTDLKHVYDAHFHAFMAVEKLVSVSFSLHLE